MWTHVNWVWLAASLIHIQSRCIDSGMCCSDFYHCFVKGGHLSIYSSSWISTMVSSKCCCSELETWWNNSNKTLKHIYITHPHLQHSLLGFKVLQETTSTTQELFIRTFNTWILMCTLQALIFITEGNLKVQIWDWLNLIQNAVDPGRP